MNETQVRQGLPERLYILYYRLLYLLFSNAFYTSNTLLFTYMLIYNLTLIVLFWTLMSSIITSTKTLYSFSKFSFNSPQLLFLTLSLLSMAGVPPFIGFFSKVFILQIILNSNMFLLYFLLFILLFVGLYFYIQNLRFLHSTNQGYNNLPYVYNERVAINYVYYSILVMFLLIFGFFYIDDLLLIMTWLFL